MEEFFPVPFIGDIVQSTRHLLLRHFHEVELLILDVLFLRLPLLLLAVQVLVPPLLVTLVRLVIDRWMAHVRMSPLFLIFPHPKIPTSCTKHFDLRQVQIQKL